MALLPPPPSSGRRRAPESTTNPFVDPSSQPVAFAGLVEGAMPAATTTVPLATQEIVATPQETAAAAAAEWSIFDELETKSPDQIDLEIEQMERDLAKLNAISSDYATLEADPVSQGLLAAPPQLLNQVPTSSSTSPMGEGIYDTPDIPTIPPPPRVQKAHVSQPQSAPAAAVPPPSDASRPLSMGESSSWLEFESPLPIGSAAAQSFTQFPPQSAQQPVPAPAASAIGDSSTIDRRAVKDLPLTHRGIHNFAPRHDEEISIRKGDPMNVDQATGDANDGWLKGTNLRTGKIGIFPAAVVMEKSNPGLRAALGIDSERFIVRFLGTVPLKRQKGLKYVTAAIEKVHSDRNEQSPPPSSVSVLQINKHGIKVFNTIEGKIDTSKNPRYFPLQNITYIASHPNNKRYFGFIFQIPSRDGVFACYIFASASSTVPICSALGRAFQKLKEAFLNYSNPTKDYYIE
ncbi:C-Jun-amino-terminal kinase-interacting protein 1-like isoform X3 [Oscarella lobularis]|uniref:C-Jun-amino-terminal kinase-interacting protein 1-like isoform X3 n=1 Tax=Oscarella lobularis TaxID=121494 RepID=UPI0033133168